MNFNNRVLGQLWKQMHNLYLKHLWANTMWIKLSCTILMPKITYTQIHYQQDYIILMPTSMSNPLIFDLIKFCLIYTFKSPPSMLYIYIYTVVEPEFVARGRGEAISLISGNILLLSYCQRSYIIDSILLLSLAVSQESTTLRGSWSTLVNRK